VTRITGAGVLVGELVFVGVLVRLGVRVNVGVGVMVCVAVGWMVVGINACAVDDLTNSNMAFPAEKAGSHVPQLLSAKEDRAMKRDIRISFESFRMINPLVFMMG
jgi:hypothetical protein